MTFSLNSAKTYPNTNYVHNNMYLHGLCLGHLKEKRPRPLGTRRRAIHGKNVYNNNNNNTCMYYQSINFHHSQRFAKNENNSPFKKKS